MIKRTILVLLITLASFVNNYAAVGEGVSEVGTLSSSNTTDIMEIETNPTEYSLQQNYPNPFNPLTVINYSIPSNDKQLTTNVKLIVYDVLGHEVGTLVNEQQSAGNYQLIFDASNLSSGVYHYKLKAGDFLSTKKMLLLK